MSPRDGSSESLLSFISNDDDRDLTESNKPFIRFGVTGTDILRYHRSYLGRFRERKHRAKNEVEPRVHWTLNTTHQFIIIASSMIS